MRYTLIPIVYTVDIHTKDSRSEGGREEVNYAVEITAKSNSEEGGR